MDKYFDMQTPESFQTVCAIKVQGIENLDQLTRQAYSDHLDWFVAFSSMSASMGNAAQTNYAYANSYMERVVKNV